jgi:hypothetical protein
MACPLKSYGIMAAVLFLWANVGSAAPQPVPSHRLTHHLSLRLDPPRHMLAAVDKVTVEESNGPRLAFLLAGHLRVAHVRVNGEAAAYAYKKGRLSVSQPLPSPPYRIDIEYSGVFDDEIPMDPVNTDNPGFGVTGTISRHGTMLLAGAQWYPHSPGADARYEITVNAPKDIVAITSGSPMGHVTENGRTISRWRVNRPIRGLPLVAGPYIVATKQFDGVAAATYFTKPLQHLSTDYLDAVGRYLRFYQELFGPYAFEQFAVVENSFPTGYGFPSFTLMGRRVLQLPFIIHTSLGHEIAHCWWGNGVLVDAAQGNWSEGLTTYVSDYLYKERRGEGRSYRRQWLRNYAELVPEHKGFALSQFMSRTDPASMAVGYGKAAMVFHMLRRKAGEEAFWGALRDVYARYKFTAITWSDFQKVFEERSGTTLAPFFRQWVFRPGAPELTLSAVTRAPADQGFEISGRVRQQAPYYDLPLALALETDQGTTLHPIHISGPRTPFTITADRPPGRLTADPDVHLFRRLASQEVPPTINTIKGAASVSIVVAQHLEPSAMALARRLSRAMGLSRVRIGREKDFSTKELNGDNLLFIGRPSKKAGMPRFGGLFALTSEGFTVDGETYGGGQTSFFGVFPHPDDEKRIAAIFMPGSLSVATSLSTKIPHYGKYSYLVFDGTRNQVKGTWTAENSPLSVHWPTTSTTDWRRQ